MVSWSTNRKSRESCGRPARLLVWVVWRPGFLRPSGAKPRCHTNSAKERQIYRIPHRLMTCRPGMQMISTVILGSHAARSRRVAESGIKIDDPVERPRRSNPPIYRHALRFTRCGPSANALIWENGRAENLETPGVRPGDDLFVSRDDFIRSHLRPAATRTGIRGGSVRLTNVVCAFEQNHGPNSGLRQNTASQPGRRRLSPARRTGQPTRP